jgi:hypothetical protein
VLSVATLGCPMRCVRFVSDRGGTCRVTYVRSEENESPPSKGSLPPWSDGRRHPTASVFMLVSYNRSCQAVAPSSCTPTRTGSRSEGFSSGVLDPRS